RQNAGPRGAADIAHRRRRGDRVKRSPFIALGALPLPGGERVGVRGGETHRETLTPHPSPLPIGGRASPWHFYRNEPPRITHCWRTQKRLRGRAHAFFAGRAVCLLCRTARRAVTGNARDPHRPRRRLRSGCRGIC